MSSADIYFDHNATTTLDVSVLEVMSPFLSQQHGNPTSRHSFGRHARSAIERAREQVADAVNAHPSQVIFTSGGTEANNLAITGIASSYGKSQIVTSAIEHPCVTRPALAMKQRGWQLNTLSVDNAGVVELSALDAILDKDTCILSVMLANNETGVIQPVAELAEVARRHGITIHTDAVQALGKTKVDFKALNVHAMTLSSHKINGPQGAGALVLDKRIDIQPVLYGGGQERGLRSGTENVAAIVGFGAACELLNARLLQHTSQIRQLRDRLEIGLSKLGATIFGANTERLSNTSFFAFNEIEGETLVMAMDRKGFAIASGSACSSDSSEPSSVLLAMGIERDLAKGAIRVSLGASNTSEQIDAFLNVLGSEITRLRQLTAIAV
ncbi:MAG: cysteine desulfurase family protein [Methylophilaceae bacterium]|nr:cysteine desulfurase family protein [Methylophilaceae bacterium]